MKSCHATSVLLSAFIVEEYATALKERGLKPNEKIVTLLSGSLNKVLQEPESLPHFRELVPTLKAVRTFCLQLFDVFVTAAKLSPSRIPQIPVVVQGEAEAGPGAFGLETAEKICNETFVKLKNICRQLIGYLLIKLLKTLNIESLLLWKNLVWLLHQEQTVYLQDLQLQV